MAENTLIMSVHPFRRMARTRERKIQAFLDAGRRGPVPYMVPIWAQGVRVEKAGPRQWAVVATDRRGR